MNGMDTHTSVYLLVSKLSGEVLDKFRTSTKNQGQLQAAYEAFLREVVTKAVLRDLAFVFDHPTVMDPDPVAVAAIRKIGRSSAERVVNSFM